MSFNRKDLKMAAKEQLKGNVGIYFGVTILLSLILSLSSITIIGPFLISGSIMLGLTLLILEIVRTKKGNLETGFKGFKQFGSSLGAYFFMGLFIGLWSILFVIPGIIAGFRYSMTFFVLADNPTMSGLAAIRKSKEMMKGHKWELFVLLISFFWWYILGTITFGLAYIYVIPYMEATIANFYEKLKEEQPVAEVVEEKTE